MSDERDFIGYGRSPPDMVWPGGARLAVSISVLFAEGAERTPYNGDDQIERDTEGMVVEGNARDLNVESMFEYGARRGVWRLLDILKEFDVPATFFCCGRALEQNPEAGRAIAAAGHEIAAHGYRWVPHYGWSSQQIQDDAARCVAAIEATTGRTPVGWLSRVPSASTREAIVRISSLTYDSDDYSDDVPRRFPVAGRDWVTVPFTLDVSDEKFWSIMQSSGFRTPGDFLTVMTETFATLHDESRRYPRMMSIALRPRISGRPSRAEQLWRFLETAVGTEGVWFATRAQIAAWWSERT